MKICPTCSSHYPDDANFCPMDATRLKPLAAPPAPLVAPAGTGTGEAVGNRFLLKERIANTSTAEVFLAVDHSLGERVHVKIIHHQALPVTAMADRALREFKQLAKLKSERIARIIDQGKFDDGRIYVVTEVLDGPTLAELVELEGPLPLERAKAIILGVGEALAEAQKVGVIHRDVSPRCVVLQGTMVKVTDFGVAEPVTERVFGTPPFLSPEQAEGKPVDQRSNIYSLGTLYYYLLTGAPPFSGDVSALLQQHLHAQPRPPSQSKPGVPPDVDRVVLKALEKSGGRRHLTLRQMLNEVAGIGLPAGGRTTRNPEERARESGMMVETGATMSGAMTPAAGGMAAGERPGLLGATMVSSPRATPTPGRVLIEPVRLPVRDATPTPRRETRTERFEMPSASPEKPMAVDEAMRYGAAAPMQPPVVQLQPPVVQLQPPVVQLQPRATPPPAGVVYQEPISSTKEAQPQPAAFSAGPAAFGGPTAATPMTGTPQVVPQTAGPTQAAGAAGATQAGAAPRRAFRETAWFKKGELEEAAAGEAPGHPDDPLAGPPALPAEVDEGSLTVEDHKRLSLKTGRTEAMAAVKPQVELPGDHMSEAELLAEVDSSRKWLVASGIGVAVVVLIAAVYFLFVRAPTPGPTGTGAPPAATAPK